MGGREREGERGGERGRERERERERETHWIINQTDTLRMRKR